MQFKISSKLSIFAVALLVIAFAANVGAQEVSTGQATANVLAVLVVTAPQDLDFGDILQGVVATVAPTSATQAGIFQIAGEGSANQEVSMNLQLPEYLWNSGAGVQDRLPIAFAATDATIDTTSGTPDAPGAGALTNQNPHNLPDTGIGGTDNVIRIYLGGTVNPSVDQRAGAYAADIILTAAYTGD
jgi:hypothetical protein